VKQDNFRPRRCRLLAGGVEELWKAEFCSILDLHLQRIKRAAAVAAV